MIENGRTEFPEIKKRAGNLDKALFNALTGINNFFSEGIKDDGGDWKKHHSILEIVRLIKKYSINATTYIWGKNPVEPIQNTISNFSTEEKTLNLDPVVSGFSKRFKDKPLQFLAGSVINAALMWNLSPILARLPADMITNTYETGKEIITNKEENYGKAFTFAFSRMFALLQSYDFVKDAPNIAIAITVGNILRKKIITDQKKNGENNHSEESIKQIVSFINKLDEEELKEFVNEIVGILEEEAKAGVLESVVEKIEDIINAPNKGLVIGGVVSAPALFSLPISIPLGLNPITVGVSLYGAVAGVVTFFATDAPKDVVTFACATLLGASINSIDELSEFDEKILAVISNDKLLKEAIDNIKGRNIDIDSLEEAYTTYQERIELVNPQSTAIENTNTHTR